MVVLAVDVVWSGQDYKRWCGISLIGI